MGESLAYQDWICFYSNKSLLKNIERSVLFPCWFVFTCFHYPCGKAEPFVVPISPCVETTLLVNPVSPLLIAPSAIHCIMQD